jgi:hypothetical protein
LETGLKVDALSIFQPNFQMLLFSIGFILLGAALALLTICGPPEKVLRD